MHQTVTMCWQTFPSEEEPVCFIVNPPTVNQLHELAYVLLFPMQRLLKVQTLLHRQCIQSVHLENFLHIISCSQLFWLTWLLFTAKSRTLWKPVSVFAAHLRWDVFQHVFCTWVILKGQMQLQSIGGGYLYQKPSLEHFILWHMYVSFLTAVCASGRAQRALIKW